VPDQTPQEFTRLDAIKASWAKSRGLTLTHMSHQNVDFTRVTVATSGGDSYEIDLQPTGTTVDRSSGVLASAVGKERQTIMRCAPCENGLPLRLRQLLKTQLRLSTVCSSRLIPGQMLRVRSSLSQGVSSNVRMERSVIDKVPLEASADGRSSWC
jgi:hypothetical protein